MNGAAQGMIDKPLIDRTAAASGVRRLLLLGGALILAGASLAMFGRSYGEVAVFVIFGFLSMIGIAAVFASALGLLRFSNRASDGGIAKDFLDTARTGLLILDRRGQVVYANRAYGDLTGVARPGEVRSLERLLAREAEATEAIYHLANLARDGRAGQREFRLAHSLAPASQGENVPCWYRVSVRPLPSRGGQMQAWQILDITADRKHEESSFQDLQHAIDYLDKAPAGFFASDAEHRIAYINATLAEWLGLDLADVKPYQRSFVEFLAPSCRALYTERSKASAEGIEDIDLITASGRSLPVRLLRRPVGDDSAAPGIVRTLVLDRSGENDAATPVELAEARFTRFFNSSPMAIATLNPSGRVVRSNPVFRRLFGAEAAEGAASFPSAIREAGHEGFRKALAEAETGRSGIAPVDAEVAEERPRTIRLYLSPVPKVGPDSDECAILYGVDITEQRALEDQIAKSQKMQAIGNLAGGIAHDFNNVLTIITASVDFLLLNHRTGDPSFQDLLLIKQSANRAASLVRQLLAYSRRQTMRPKMLNLTDVVADMHLLLKRVSGDHAQLERQHARDLWPVMADIGQFEQVITNLVQNARDAMPNGGKITIATRNVRAEETAQFGYAELVDGDYVLVEVSDTGSGMPPEVAERIFEPFFTTKEIGKGTGLGLSMVYGIIKQSNGFIYVDSTPGEGTAFRIFLPRFVSEEAVGQSSEMAAAAAGAAGAKMDLSGTATILLVEDEDNVRAVNSRALTMRGYDVKEAASGVEALEVLEELGGKVDIVVSDVVMPEMDGPTLLREMRKTRPDLKFIFVSGYAEEAFAKNMPEGEKFGFLAKPFSLRELAVAVKTMLNEG